MNRHERRARRASHCENPNWRLLLSDFHLWTIRTALRCQVANLSREVAGGGLSAGEVEAVQRTIADTQATLSGLPEASVPDPELVLIDGDAGSIARGTLH